MSATSTAARSSSAPDQSRGQLGLHGDDGERVSQDVVQVACHARPLLLDHHLRHLVAGFREVAVAAHGDPGRVDSRAGEEDRERP